MPDKRLGEEVCAAIRVKEGHEITEQEVKDFCKGKVRSQDSGGEV